jgi:hypothetical protein
VGLGRIELPTSPLSGVRSSHLSYRPKQVFPLWWSWSGSNRRPPACKAGALPAELQPPDSCRGRVLRAPQKAIEAGWTQAASGTCPKTCQISSSYPQWRIRGGLPDLAVARPGVGVERLSARCARTPPTFSLRKEVIQPQVLLRLPCYDFTPIMSHTVDRCLPCGSACGLLVQPTFVM